MKNQVCILLLLAFVSVVSFAQEQKVKIVPGLKKGITLFKDTSKK